MIKKKQTLISVQWCPLCDLLLGWGNVGGSEAGWVGVFAAEDARSSGEDTNLGSKTHKLPFPPSSPVCCGGLHILTLRDMVGEFPHPYLLSQGRGTMGDKKEKANKTCFEQKNKEAKSQMKHYHFKRVKK